MKYLILKIELLFVFGDRNHNCSTIIAELLIAGGIDQAPFRGIGYQNPIKVLEGVNVMKEHKLRAHPETTEFDKRLKMEFDRISLGTDSPGMCTPF